MTGRGKYFAFILLVAALSIFVLACGEETATTGTGGVTETTLAPETTVTTEATTETTVGGGAAELPDLSGQQVEVAAVWTGTEQANFEQVIAAFEDETGADVVYQSTGNDIAAVLGTRIQGGNPPDVAFLPQPGLMPNLIQQNALQPLPDAALSLMDQNYEPVWKEIGSVDGEVYGLMFKAANKSTMWYNTTIFEDAGVEPPADWDALVQLASDLQAYGVAPLSVAGADGWTLTDWFENVYLRTAGPDMYDQLTRHEIPWTDQSVTTALERLAEIFTNDFVAGGNNGALQVDFPTSVKQVFVDPPDAAMVYEGDFVAGVISGETEVEVGEGADFFPFPAIDGSEDAVVAGGDMAVMMTDSEGAQAFMQFLATPEASQIWAELGGFTSPNKGVAADSYPNEILGRAAEAMTAAPVVRFDMSDQMPVEFGGTPSRGEWKALQDFLANPENVEQIQQQLEELATQAYGSGS